MRRIAAPAKAQRQAAHSYARMSALLCKFAGEAVFLSVVSRTMILTSIALLAACADGQVHSICHVNRLPVDQSYKFTDVAIYSDGHTTLAFDNDDPQCDPVALEGASTEDMQPIWKITSQSTSNSTIGAVGNVTAQVEKLGSRAVRLKFVGADKWEARNIDAQVQALDARMLKPNDPS